MEKTRTLKFWTSIFLLISLCGLILAKCWAESYFQHTEHSIDQLSLPLQKVILNANNQVGKTLFYDPSYKKLDYPNGDIPIQRGVCTDVIIRALRGAKFDLQKQVHLDMKKRFAEYPNHWGLKKPDPNIDHRRVPNLEIFFKKMGWSKNISKNKKDYLPGDIVTWKLGNGRDHIGLVTNRKSLLGRPIIVHNIGKGAQFEDVLFDWKIRGHFRPQLEKAL